MAASLPFWGPGPDCRGPACRGDPWRPAGDDLAPRPAAASGSGGRRRDPGRARRCQPATALPRADKEITAAAKNPTTTRADTDTVYEKYYNQITQSERYRLYLARAKTGSVFLHLDSETSHGLKIRKNVKKNCNLPRDDAFRTADKGGDTVAAEAINVIRATFIGAAASSITVRRVGVNASVMKIREHYLQKGPLVKAFRIFYRRRLYKQLAPAASCDANSR